MSTIQFDVNLSCENCSTSVRNALSKMNGIESIEIETAKQLVVVKSSLPSQLIKEAIEKTGKRAVLKGVGAVQGERNLGSAVAEIKSSPGVIGVIRFHQMAKNLCVIDGTIDGLNLGDHGLHIHEFGDLSDGCNSIGPHLNPANAQHGGLSDKEKHYGDLGNISADYSGRASFRMEDNVIYVPDIIGRSIAVTSNRDDLGRGTNESSKVDGNSGQILACGIIARSAGLFENPKRFCQCDGVSIWDETKMPSSL